VLRERYARARLTDHQTAAIRWLVAQLEGPARILVLSEDWSSDCRRDVPMLARLAGRAGWSCASSTGTARRSSAPGALTRPPPPDANHDLMLEFMNKKNGGEWSRPGRAAREFAALQVSPFFDLWASAAIDQILSALHEKAMIDVGA
jgi:hypothetical protein